MNGLEKITARIQADARERARIILQEAEEDCRRITAEYDERAEAARRRIEDENLRAGETLVARTRTEAANYARDLTQTTRAALLDRAFEEAKQNLRSTDYGKYRELLVALLVSALLEQDRAETESREWGDEEAEIDRLEVLLNTEDRERFGPAVIEGARKIAERRVGREKAAALTLSDKTADIDGGVVLRFGNVELNCSLTVILADLRQELETSVAAVLFGNENR